MCVPPLLLLCLVLVIPALRPLVKFMPYPDVLVPCVAVGLFGGIGLLLHPPAWAKRLLATPWPIVVGIMGLALFAAAVYPAVDARKYVGAGSDADDALIVGAQALAQGLSPYVFTTYFGNPLSPGTGWITLTAPFSLVGVEPLLGVLGLLLLLATLPDWPTRNRVGLLLLGCPLVWELTASGNDLLPLAFLLTALTRGLLTRQPAWMTAGLTVLLGTTMTGRVVLAAWGGLLGLLLWPKGKTQAVTLALASTAITVVWHALFYGLSPTYPPFHLIGKGEALLPPLAWVPLALVGVVWAGWLLWNMKRPPEQLLAVALVVPFGLLALADLVARGGDMAAWEGANYIIPALPAVIIALSRGEKLLQPRG